MTDHLSLDQLAEQAAQSIAVEVNRLGGAGISDITRIIREAFEAATQTLREQIASAQDACIEWDALHKKQRERAEKAEQHLAQATQDLTTQREELEMLRELIMVAGRVYKPLCRLAPAVEWAALDRFHDVAGRLRATRSVGTTP